MESKHQGTEAPASEDSAWRALLEGQWDALRRQVLGLDPSTPRKMSEILQECQALTAVAAWYEAGGNITRAAERLGAGRRRLRGHITKWKETYPELPPPTLARKSPPIVPRGRGS